MHNDLQIVSGEIAYLEVGKLRVDLLSQHVSKGAQGAAAALQAATGNLGLAATSASVAMSDTDEEMQAFAFWVGDDMIQGILPFIQFKNGDAVNVVYELIDNQKQMRAIHRNLDNMLWIPLMLDSGVGAIARQAKNQGLFNVLVCLFMTFIFSLFDKKMPDNQMIIFTTLIGIGLGLIFGVWDFLSSRARGQLSTAIFRKLGLPNPIWLDLRPYSLIRLKRDLKGECMYDLKAMYASQK